MARVPDDEGALGGIVSGMIKEEVIAIYGAPKEGKVPWAAELLGDRIQKRR